MLTKPIAKDVLEKCLCGLHGLARQWIGQDRHVQAIEAKPETLESCAGAVVSRDLDDDVENDKDNDLDCDEDKDQNDMDIDVKRGRILRSKFGWLEVCAFAPLGMSLLANVLVALWCLCCRQA